MLTRDLTHANCLNPIQRMLTHGRMDPARQSTGRESRAPNPGLADQAVLASSAYVLLWRGQVG